MAIVPEGSYEPAETEKFQKLLICGYASIIML